MSGPKIYKRENVYEAALDRIRWCFDEFPEVVVSVSGGKDSTVLFNLAMIVAREKDRLPLRVSWIDQEAEWQATADTVKEQMYHPDVKPHWYQMPMKLFNATSTTEHWLECWSPDAEDRWMRERDPIAITENVYGTDRFGDLFKAIPKVEFPDTRVCYLAGVRTEESPSRFIGLTSDPTYKWATWGKQLSPNQQHVTMYPLYDWSYTDIWKAIHDNDWPYNPIYDAQYQHGVQVRMMRISNVHHETAVHAIWLIQEIEPETWGKLTQRLGGIDATGKIGAEDFFLSELPFMFGSWREYRDYLLDKLIENPDWKAGFEKIFARQEGLYADEIGDQLYKVHCNSIVTNDWEHVKLKNFEAAPNIYGIRKEKARRAAREAEGSTNE